MSTAGSDKMTRNIFLALMSGLVLGLILHYTGVGHVAEYLKPLGDIFIKFLKMMIIPLVMSSIFVAMVNLGTPEELGSMGVKALIYYFLTTAIAAGIGLVVVNMINPGQGLDIGSLGSTGMSEALNTKLSNSAETGLWKTILGVMTGAIPDNPFHAMANSTILQVIVFSLLFGVTALFYRQEAEPFVSFMKSLESLSMGLTHGLMKFAPVGIFALMLHVIATTGFTAISALAKYMVTVVLGLVIHFCVLLFIGMARSKKNPVFIIKGVISAVMTAFSTSSSAATLPITMANVEDNLGVDRKTAQFVLPLGATVNMDGTALYESVAVIFIGQAYGLDISLANQLIIFMTASIAAVGAAAIPGAGLVTMSIVLSAVGFPLEGIGLILAVDRILDMFRTSVNVFGDCIGTVVVDSFNKEKQLGAESK
jgi:proton glutamate symport protein